MKNRGIQFPEVEIDRVWMDVLGFGSRAQARAFALKFELMTNPVYPMPHAREVIDRCRQQGIRLGIISNAQFYTAYLFDWFFHAGPAALGFDPDLLFFSYRLGCAKPSETLFRLAVRALHARGIPAASALYVGNDMLNDIYPAQKSGFRTALFAGDARSLRLRRQHPLCRSLAADIVLTDLNQVFDYLQG